jgi:hypothetical protein
MRKIAFKDCSCTSLDRLFGLKQVETLPSLDDLLSRDSEINDFQRSYLLLLQDKLNYNVLGWNEQELALHFIGPLTTFVDFTDKEGRFNEFAERTFSAQINDDVELEGKPDGIIATGRREPEMPIFCLQEFKKQLDSSGDPAGQVLAAMVASQKINENDMPIYGCWILGRDWSFMTLEGKKYAMSRGHVATNDDIFEIFKILQGLKQIIIERVNL